MEGLLCSHPQGVSCACRSAFDEKSEDVGEAVPSKRWTKVARLCRRPRAFAAPWKAKATGPRNRCSTFAPSVLKGFCRTSVSCFGSSAARLGRSAARRRIGSRCRWIHTIQGVSFAPCWLTPQLVPFRERRSARFYFWCASAASGGSFGKEPPSGIGAAGIAGGGGIVPGAMLSGIP